MGEYDSSIALAQRLIAKKGFETQIIRQVAVMSGTDPTEVQSVTTTTHDVSVVLLSFRVDREDGKGVQRGDQYILLSPVGLSIVPTEEDAVLINNDKWSLENVVPINPGGETVIYKIQVRPWPRRLTRQ